VITRRVPARRLFGLHPALTLAMLDLVALMVAGYLSVVELAGVVPSCGLVHGCETVATSQYARIGGVPVALMGVLFTASLLIIALAWWRSDLYGLLLGHYGLSLVGVLFNVYLFYLQAFVIRAMCIWCLTFEAATLLAFVVALVLYLRQPKPEVEQ
jgi:uncharacterized membrane protein